MVRIILGAVVGFIVWTIFLFISDAIWMMLSPDFYGTQQAALQAAITNKTPFTMATTIMVIAVLRSAVFTVITGFIAASISKENFKSPLLLGIFLLAFGSFVHSMILDYVPVWYHVLILLPLIPLSILGGKLQTKT
ncbi:MAG TPA: hypothetical protein PKY59_02525 [Pyrinomonadaceae bacterium]|nr:hypothetical protein [Pyrinomonadaceae bacterium]